MRFQFSVDAEPGGGVCYLPQQRSRETTVKTGYPFIFEYVHEGSNHRFGGLGLAGLEPNLCGLFT